MSFIFAPLTQSDRFWRLLRKFMVCFGLWGMLKFTIEELSMNFGVIGNMENCTLLRVAFVEARERNRTDLMKYYFSVFLKYFKVKESPYQTIISPEKEAKLI